MIFSPTNSLISPYPNNFPFSPMAVDVSEPFTSPRISFSFDLNNQPPDTTTTSTSTTTTTIATTFEFCITLNLLQQITTADELFYNGVLLPTQIKKPENLLLPKPETPTHENYEAMHVQRKRLKELLSDNDQEQKQEKSSSIFWKFARSASLNSENCKRPKRLFRSLSLKRMLHSNSTERENNAPVIVEEMNSGKEPTMLKRCSRGDGSFRRPVTKKNSGGGNKVNPVLNIPPAYYNMNLFGSSSLFCKPKYKNK